MSKAELLNPFFTSVYDCLEEISGESVKRGKLYLQKDRQFASRGFSVLIVITGQLQGRVILDMSKKVAIKFAEIMNMEEIGEFNDQVKSSIKEMANSVCEQSSEKLSKMDIEVNIDSPSLIETEQVDEGGNNNVAIIAAPLELPFGELVIYLSLNTVSDK